jgi:DMSO/TMAO reductase YedYZ molybdopterin-dependent catalytic subunit
VTPRATDWGLAALVAALIASGVLTLFAGSSSSAWVYDLHDALGVAIAVLLAVKLRRVWPRLSRRAASQGGRVASIAGLVIVVAALASGFLWSDGVTPAPAGYSLLSWHEALGAVLVAAVAVHMVMRAKPLRGADLAHRRQFLALGGIAASSLIVWRAQRPLQALFGLKAATRRFTGSYEAGSFMGNAFPSTSWVADNPRPLDLSTYRLAVRGLVSQDLALSLGELDAGDERIATLDCTGGFYSTQRWRGVRVDTLFALAGVHPAAHHVSVVSITGYRWSFALDTARELLLATHVGGEPLSHAHGAPVRLVAPGARGFQWVKWVTALELRADPDYGAPASTVWSSFT